MTLKMAAAVALLAGAASSGLALAVPAQADPAGDQRTEQLNQAFLQGLKDRGLRLKPDVALDLAQSTCGTLARTQSVERALVHVRNATDWTDDKDVGAFAGLAVQAFCPTSMPKP